MNRTTLNFHQVLPALVVMSKNKKNNVFIVEIEIKLKFKNWWRVEHWEAR